MYRTKEFVILAVATLVLILECYFVLLPQPLLFFVSAWFYLLLIPVVTLLLLGESIRHYGFSWNTWPFRTSHTVLIALGILLLVIGSSALPQVQEHHASKTPALPSVGKMVMIFGCLYFAEEFFFRGFLLFGLRKQFGEFSIVLQAVPFALFHIGGPPIEVISSFFVGLLLGHIAYRTNSFLPCFLIHWAMGSLLFALIFL